MRITLSDGRIILIGTRFGNEEPPKPDRVVRPAGKFRSLRYRLTLFGPEGGEKGSLEGTGYCSPLDQFSRSEGRKYAMRRLFAANRNSNLLTREDCHAVSPALLAGKVVPKEKEEAVQ